MAAAVVAVWCSTSGGGRSGVGNGSSIGSGSECSSSSSSGSVFASGSRKPHRKA